MTAPPAPTLASPPALAQLGDRQLFPQLQAQSYLNHAAVSPPSAPVQRALLSTLEAYAQRGMGAVAAALAQRQQLRERVARLFGGQPDHWAFLSNTTAALNAIALSFPWRAGDRVLLLEGDFPTNVSPWLAAAQREQLEPRWLKAQHFEGPHGADLAPLEAELRRGVRLVTLSLVRFQTGTRLPIEEISALCQRYGAQLCVDAIQAAGAVPFNLEAADYLACGGHKWLMGLEGTALLYVRPERISALRPSPVGWLSHQDAVSFLQEPDRMRYDRPLREDTRVFEGGAGNAVGLSALNASLDLIEQLGVPSIFAHIQDYLDRLEPLLEAHGFLSLRSADPARRSGILTVRPQPSVHGPRATLTAIAQGMAQHGVAISTPDGQLRFAPHWPNNVAELSVIEEALDHTLRALRTA